MTWGKTVVGWLATARSNGGGSITIQNIVDVL